MKGDMKLYIPREFKVQCGRECDPKAILAKAKGGRMSKHTPGPWKLVFRNAASKPDWIIRDSVARTGVEICRLPKTTTKTASEVAANARLIAAAPGLLEACEWAIADFSRKPDPKTEPYTAKGYNLIRAAIAKAKGGVP